jgi:antitoxin VapB
MISIRNPEVERVARELAAAEGRSMTETILDALRHVKAESDHEGEQKKAMLKAIAQACAAAPDLDSRHANEILSYDADGAFDHGRR